MYTPGLRRAVVACRVLPAVLALLASLDGDVTRAKELFGPDHVARIRLVSGAVISPDGHSIAYVLRVPRSPFEEETGPAWAELHVIFPNGSSRPFVTGEVNVGNIEWTPDGREIAFLAKRGKDLFQSLYTIPVDGGEARKVLSFTSDIKSFTLSPRGERVAFIASEAVPEEEKKLREQGFNQQIYEEDYPPVRLYVANLSEPADSPRSVELGGFPSSIHWAPRGNRLLLALAPTPLVDDSYMKRRLHVLDVDSGKVLTSIKNPGKLGMGAWSPDGESMAYISGEDINDPSAGRLMVVLSNGGEPRDLVPDFAGEFTDVAWKDGETIVYLAAVGVWSQFGEIRKDGTGHEVRVEPGKVVLSGLSLSRDGRTAAMLSESPRHPSEVHVMSSGNALPRRLTDSNPWLESLRFATQEVVTHKARDGLLLEGILIRPLDEEKGKRYPLILSVHGGPESHDKNGWLTSYVDPGQVGAARGFAVFYPNYRGSTGRGVEFSKKGQADYAGKEFDDLVDAVDHLVTQGLVDVHKVGITGGSYGGFASAWGATYYSSRFAASVMFVGISDQISKAGTTDIPEEMYLVHARKKIYGNWRWFLERSPIFHVEKARTPLLILHGKEDPRVHPGQSLELYRHFRNLGKAPVRLVLYPGEGHGNRKSAARLDYNLRMFRWFEHYLKGAGGKPPPYRLDYGQKKEGDVKKEGTEKNGGESASP